MMVLAVGGVVGGWWWRGWLSVTSGDGWLCWWRVLALVVDGDGWLAVLMEGVGGGC